MLLSRRIAQDSDRVRMPRIHELGATRHPGNTFVRAPWLHPSLRLFSDWKYRPSTAVKNTKAHGTEVHLLGEILDWLKSYHLIRNCLADE